MKQPLRALVPITIAFLVSSFSFSQVLLASPIEERHQWSSGAISATDHPTSHLNEVITAPAQKAPSQYSPKQLPPSLIQNVPRPTEVEVDRDQEFWIHYFATLAETVAVTAALLLTFAFTKMGLLQNTLTTIERSISEVFFTISEQDSYSRKTTDAVIGGQWTQYFAAVETLADKKKLSFAGPKHYNASEPYIGSLVLQGRPIAKTFDRFDRPLKISFGASIILTIVSIFGFYIAKQLPQFVFCYGICCFFAVSLLLLYFVFLVALAGNSK